MNQILLNLTENRKRKKFFIILFYISIILVIFSIIYFLFFYYAKNNDENFSVFFKNHFNLERLYAKNENYITVELNGNDNFFVIGMIEIPKINIEYPILSTINDELLKISPCKFYGPYPNKIGNLCIAAHNYDDNRFFSNLHNLNIGDSINIYDSKNFLVTYYVYEKYEISLNDTSCTSQNTNGKREITLVTCNNITKNRLIVKAREN